MTPTELAILRELSAKPYGEFGDHIRAWRALPELLDQVDALRGALLLVAVEHHDAHHTGAWSMIDCVICGLARS